MFRVSNPSRAHKTTVPGTSRLVIKSFLDTLQRPMVDCDPLLLSLFVPVQVSLIGTPVVYHRRRFLHA